MPNWKKIVVSGSDATLNSLFVSNAVTASRFSGSFTGSLFGTASYVTGSVFTSANPALSASYALTASYALNGGGGGAITIADEGTAQGTATFLNFIGNGVQAVVASNTASITFTGGVASGSVALHTQAVAANTWSFVHNLANDYPVVNVWDSNGFVIIPGGIKSKTNNDLEIYFDIAQTGYASAVVGGVAVSASVAVSSSYALTASYALNSSAATSDFPYTGSAIISGSLRIIQSGSTGLVVTGSVISTGGFTGSLVGTSSWAQNAVTASFVTTAQTASFITTAQTASYVTGSVFTSANPALSASFATTASFASNGGVTSFNTRTGAVTLQASDISNLGAGIVSASVFSSPSQGTLRAVINGVQTDVDLGLQTTDNVTFGQVTGSNALFSGTITAQTLVVQTVTSSVDFVTGSTRFGTLLTDTHRFTGSVSITGSFSVTGVTTINTQQNATINTGTSVVATVSTASAYAAFFDYVARSGSATQNLRAGTITSVWNTTGTAEYTDVSTVDIGNTAGVTLAVVANGANAELRATVTTDSWNIKTFVRAI